MKNYIKLLIIISVIISFSKIIAKKTDIFILNTYNQINQNLLNLKQDYPQTQTTVYSLLDQVCNLYKASKNISEKRFKNKTELKIKIQENVLLKTENIKLKSSIKDLESKFNLSQKEIETKNKALAKNSYMLNYVNKEKEQMQNKVTQLQEEQKHLLIKNSQPENKDLNSENNQSLSLTSTCAPNSSL
ncbi:MAG: hypothetical protein SZ59_C0002G0029 [candidate division TM6 bacterium GW2011_GWF2_28_16]|nr:MAG: hypothetical protein SZ59_C0002G0029 [candidate division TM6 bacterium GW2011_GWF2_28_16]